MRIGKIKLAIILVFVIFFSALIFNQSKSYAASGINPELSFEGKIVTASGINIPNGTYNMEFKIYSGGTATGGGTLVWTEDWLVGGSGGVTFNSGTFQVNLGSITPFGSSVNWNSNPLYLSMQIGNTSSCTITTTFQSNCGGDGEMTPYILLTATPYSFDSSELNGLGSAAFGQLSQSQTWTGNNNFNEIGIGTATPEGQLNVQTGTYTSDQVLINDGVTGSPPAFPDSYTPSLVVQTAETTGSRPLFFGYNAGSTWGAFLTSGACASFNYMCLDLGQGSTVDTALVSEGNILSVGGGPDGNFSTVIIPANLNLGTATGVNGQVTLNSSGGTNTVAIAAPTTNPSASYTLSLPIAAPATSQCLLAGSTTATQLVFGSCGVSGVTSVGALDGGTANANGATISSTTIYLQSASSSYPGLVNTTTQTFAGNKTFAGQVAIGTASTNNGQFTLNSSGGTNTVTIAAPTTNPSASYTLSLPIAAPATSQCLLAGSTTATQLIFGSCSGTGGTGGVTSVGALDGGMANAYGATISGTVIYLQSASSSYPGLVNTTTQTFAGNKTFAAQLAIGTASTTNGQFTLNSSGGTNTVAIAAPTTNPSASYTLNLPIAAPATSQCLESGATTADQLIFGTCSSGSSGVTTVGTLDGGTANAYGATISSTTIYLQSASSSYSGLVNTTTQTFAGNKTFSGTLSVSGTATLSSTLSVGGTTTLAGGATVSSFLGGTWINLPTTGASGIGSGGAGSNAWLGYSHSAGEWFTNAAAGGIDIRNTAGGLNFGNTSGAIGMQLNNNELGINMINPTTLLDVNGPIATAVSTQTANYTIASTDSTILANGAITITLPSASGITGRQYTIKNISTSTVTVASNGGTIDGSTTLSLTSEYEAITVQSNGTNWYVINEVGSTIL